MRHTQNSPTGELSISLGLCSLHIHVNYRDVFELGRDCSNVRRVSVLSERSRRRLKAANFQEAAETGDAKEMDRRMRAIRLAIFVGGSCIVDFKCKFNLRTWYSR